MPWATASCALVRGRSSTTRFMKGWPEATAQKNCTMTSPFVGQALDEVLHALLGGILVADTGLVALPEEPGALREAVLFTRWRSDCLGCLISSRSRLRIYWRLRPVRSGSLSEVVRESCHGVMVSFSRPRPSERLVMG